MRRILSVLILSSMLVSLSGCSLFSETYVSQRPHQGDSYGAQSGQQMASSYPEIYSSLVSLVAQGESAGVLILSDLSEQVGRSYMQAAVKNVMTQDPIGAFAVEDIRFDMGTNAGRLAIGVHIDYSRSRADIASIKTVRNMDEAEQLIAQGLEQAVDSLVMRVEQFELEDFSEFVRDYAAVNASMVMEVPQVMAAVYPHSGQNRLVELTFSYQTSQEELMQMQALVRPVFTAAELYVHGDTSARKKFQQLYSFLIERTDYKVRTSVTPAYSLLMEGIGDSAAFASVYATMCRQAGLECRVINGTKDGVSRAWNRVVISNRVYYIDLIEAARGGRLQFKTAAEMTGYMWER